MILRLVERERDVVFTVLLVTVVMWCVSLLMVKYVVNKSTVSEASSCNSTLMHACVVVVDM